MILTRALFLFLAFVSVQTFATDSVYMVLEQDAQGDATLRAADLSTIGDGLDPVLQFILFNTPAEPTTAQVLWQASEQPVQWVRDADDREFQFVEHVVLPAGSVIEYRVYSVQPEFEVLSARHSRTAENIDHYLDTSIIDGLPNGQYKLAAKLIVPEQADQTISQRIDIVDFAEEPENVDDFLPDENALQLGSGWTGPTKVPGQIGDASEAVIAHWNVVPEQTIEDGFSVGVIAHHLDGMDRVEISANNGPWITIDRATFNPRTNCEEFWTTLELNGHDGPIALRAIAYPKQGKPVLVIPMGETYREQDLTLYSHPTGAVLELDAGQHTLRPRDLPDVGWLTVRPKPGVAREDCILVGESVGWGKGRLKIQNVTLRMPPGSKTMRGEWDTNDEGHFFGGHVWFDGCRLIGNGPKDQTFYPVVAWETQTYTDCELSDMQNVFHSHGAINTLARNVFIHDIYEDVFRSSGLHVNITIKDVDRTPMVNAQRLSGTKVPHPDIWQYQNMPNTISQDITAVDNINAQGFFPKDVRGVALKRVKIKTESPYRAFQIMGDTQNLLIEDSRFDGGAGFRGDIVRGERMVFRNSIAGDVPPYLPDGWERTGIEVFALPNVLDDGE